jgi:hypothetical protein
MVSNTTLDDRHSAQSSAIEMPWKIYKPNVYIQYKDSYYMVRLQPENGGR